MKDYKIYASILTQPIKNDIYNYLTNFICKNSATKIQNYKQKKDKDLMLTGNILTKYAIKDYFNINFADQIIKTNENGKPYLEKFKDKYFNVSHSGNIVVCAVSNKQIGIDIQLHSEVKYINIAEKFFTNEEFEFIKNSSNIKLNFFKIWTKKESYYKMKGIGINSNMNKTKYKNCKFKYYYNFKNYTLCVCQSI